MALEQPHNDIHLAVGGYDVESGPNAADFSPIPGANGDMGENDTAGLDPIFFFHHAHVDRMFWLWQQRHGSTDSLEVISEYPNTNSVDLQGPTPGILGGSWLTLETPLNPFKKTDGGVTTYGSRDALDRVLHGYVVKGNEACAARMQGREHRHAGRMRRHAIEPTGEVEAARKQRET